MNTQQIKILLAVAEQGSISKAGRLLFLSQPAISNSIKAIEAEVGFEIYRRTNHGVTLTEQGKEFMRHASIIAEQSDMIAAIRGTTPIRRFHLIAPSSHSVEMAFAKLCNHYKDEDKLDFSIRTAVMDEMADLLYQRKADLAIFYSSVSTKTSMPKKMGQKGLVYHYVGRQPIVITIKKDHPLATGDLTAERLNKYPCIIYRNLNSFNEFSPPEVRNAMEFKRVIYVESKELRFMLAAQGVGFMLGTPYTKILGEENDLICRTVFNMSSELGYLYPAENKNNEVLNNFITYYKEELEDNLAWI